MYLIHSNPIDLQHIQLPPPPAPGAPPELPSRRAGSGLLSSWQDCMVKDPGLGINLGTAWYSTLPKWDRKSWTPDEMYGNVWKCMEMYGNVWKCDENLTKSHLYHPGNAFLSFFGVTINHGNSGQIIPHISHIQAIPIYGWIENFGQGIKHGRPTHHRESSKCISMAEWWSITVTRDFEGLSDRPSLGRRKFSTIAAVAAEPALVMIDTVISRPLKTALSTGVANADGHVWGSWCVLMRAVEVHRMGN